MINDEEVNITNNYLFKCHELINSRAYLLIENFFKKNLCWRFNFEF